jgi:hypothetical protein
MKCQYCSEDQEVEIPCDWCERPVKVPHCVMLADMPAICSRKDCHSQEDAE